MPPILILLRDNLKLARAGLIQDVHGFTDGIAPNAHRCPALRT